MTKTVYHSTIDQQQKLRILCDKLTDKLEDVLNEFGIDFEKDKKKLICCCPVHGGDNVAACNIFHVGREIRGNWKCRTQQCERTFVSSSIGLVRGILSHQKYGWASKGDKTVSFPDTIKYVEKLLGEKLSTIKVDHVLLEKQSFIRQEEVLNRKPENKKFATREIIRQNLQIPAQYYVDKGFKPEILDKYDVGLCTAVGKEMTGRIVIPVYDDKYDYMIGCTGRSIYDKCEKCGSYHTSSCPSEKDLWKYSKWKHNSTFNAQDNLFNYWFAVPEIQRTNTVILVESPGNALKLVQEGVQNVVATFGAHLTDSQKFKLDCSGAMTIILIMDNDEAGRKAREEIRALCNRTYRVFDVYCPDEFGDLGEMGDITEVIKKIKEIK